MIELLALVFIGTALLGLFALFSVLAVGFRVILWIVLLPFRLLFALLILPLLLFKLLIGGLVFLIVGPVLAILAFVAAIVIGAVVAVPLLPLLLVGAIIWMILRTGRSTALAR